MRCQISRTFTPFSARRREQMLTCIHSKRRERIARTLRLAAREHDGTSAEIEWRNGDWYRDLSAVGAGFTIILPARHYQA